AAKRDQQLTDLEADAERHLQSSFRDTRLAMNLAQAELDSEGVPRLREGAFL
ncbi:MAG: hypothetical protein JWN41_1022, partial [Thermoleophilia bacterium]|nr:hypothetical protein [Thermoleophilia bacterium]